MIKNFLLAADFMGMNSKEWILTLMLSVSAAAIFYFFVTLYRQIYNVDLENETRLTDVTSPFIKLLLPYAKSAGSYIDNFYPYLEAEDGTVIGSGFLTKFRGNLKKKLTAAGTPEGLRVNEFIGFMFVGAFLGIIFGIIAGLSLDELFRDNPEIQPSYLTPSIFFSCILGFFMPIIWLRDRATKRQFLIQKHLPFSLDLLTLSVEAGLDFTSGLDKIIDKLGNSPLAVEFANLLHEIRMGKPRAKAMRDLASRVQLDDMTSCMSSLIQADELGASLGPILRIQSEQIRINRSQRAEKKAMEAPVKILFPLICFIFPTTFIIIFGPIILKVIQGP